MRSTGSMISDMISLKESRELVRNLQARNADLLAALKAALDSMTNRKPLGTREDVLKQVRAAIVKTEG